MDKEEREKFLTYLKEKEKILKEHIADAIPVEELKLSQGRLVKSMYPIINIGANEFTAGQEIQYLMEGTKKRLERVIHTQEIVDSDPELFEMRVNCYSLVGNIDAVNRLENVLQTFTELKKRQGWLETRAAIERELYSIKKALEKILKAGQKEERLAQDLSDGLKNFSSFTQFTSEVQSFIKRENEYLDDLKKVPEPLQNIKEVVLGDAAGKSFEEIWEDARVYLNSLFSIKVTALRKTEDGKMEPLPYTDEALTEEEKQAIPQLQEQLEQRFKNALGLAYESFSTYKFLSKGGSEQPQIFYFFWYFNSIERTIQDLDLFVKQKEIYKNPEKIFLNNLSILKTQIERVRKIGEATNIIADWRYKKTGGGPSIPFSDYLSKIEEEAEKLREGVEKGGEGMLKKVWEKYGSSLSAAVKETRNTILKWGIHKILDGILGG